MQRIYNNRLLLQILFYVIKDGWKQPSLFLWHIEVKEAYIGWGIIFILTFDTIYGIILYVKVQSYSYRHRLARNAAKAVKDECEVF